MASSARRPLSARTTVWGRSGLARVVSPVRACRSNRTCAAALRQKGSVALALDLWKQRAERGLHVRDQSNLDGNSAIRSGPPSDQSGFRAPLHARIFRRLGDLARPVFHLERLRAGSHDRDGEATSAAFRSVQGLPWQGQDRRLRRSLRNDPDAGTWGRVGAILGERSAGGRRAPRSIVSSAHPVLRRCSILNTGRRVSD
jgi:hypothetical protein